MDFFDVLAVIGAVTGSIGASTQVYVALRDRADVRVSFGYDDRINQLPAPHLDIVNAGRQPVTLMDAGLYGGTMPLTIIKQGSGKRLHGEGAWKLSALASPAVLGVGEHLRLQLDFAGMLGAVVDDHFHMDFPLRPFVSTPRGRTWGDAGPFVRMIYPEEVRPPELSPHLWDRCTPPLRATRVEAKWKLWKRRELRVGRERRPTSGELERLTGSRS